MHAIRFFFFPICFHFTRIRVDSKSPRTLTHSLSLNTGLYIWLSHKKNQEFSFYGDIPATYSTVSIQSFSRQWRRSVSPWLLPLGFQISCILLYIYPYRNGTVQDTATSVREGFRSHKYINRKCFTWVLNSYKISKKLKHFPSHVLISIK